jgi:hypothetical protein
MQKHYNLSPGVFVLVLTQITVVHFMPKMTPPPPCNTPVFIRFVPFLPLLFLCLLVILHNWLLFFILSLPFLSSLPPDETRQQLRFQHLVKLSPV